MTEAQTLLHRISTFRERLERGPAGGASLVPMGQAIEGNKFPAAGAARQLAAHPELLSRTLRVLAESPQSPPNAPTPLTARARKLLEDARGLVARQRSLADAPMPDGMAAYHRATVAMTDAALKMAQALPASAEAQLRVCHGLETILGGVRDRLSTLHVAVAGRSRDAARIDGLSRRLSDLAALRVVDSDWFADLAEQLLDEARQGAPLRFLAADAGASVAHVISAHALTVAAVVARVATHDFEWASRPLTPVVAALLMDVGMVSLPVDLLSQHGELSAADRRVVEAHPAAGARLIAGFAPDVKETADAVAAHHERPDGTGYPAGLTDERTPTLAKLLNVCDAYAARCSARPHRPAQDPRSALMETLAAAELGHHDRECAELLTVLGVYPVGTVVELADGRVAVVAANHPHRANFRAASRPVLAVLTDFAGRVAPRPDFLDLAATDRGSIARTLPRTETSATLGADYPEYAD